ncbi:MAG: helix-turn-helix domain-containing protein [Candidatus Omnitrophota bacterium]
MREEKLLTVRDVSLILGISEKEVLDLAESGAIPAYKIGGIYLRFKKNQVQEYKSSGKASLHKADTPLRYPLKDKLSDFCYFNDFYILTSLIIILLLAVIFWGY